MTHPDILLTEAYGVDRPCGRAVVRCTHCGEAFTDGDEVLKSRATGEIFCSEECLLDHINEEWEIFHAYL